MSSSFRKGIAANFLGRGWAFVFQFGLLPVYVRILGLEEFGLIGLQIAAIGLLSFVDLGASATSFTV